MEKLLAYLNSLSKVDRLRFVGACKTTEGYLRKAVSTGQLLGTTTCVLIESESGGAVTRKDLHPDDWEAHWPELAAQPATRRAGDPAPELGPDSPDETPSRKNIMEFGLDQPPLYTSADHAADQPAPHDRAQTKGK
ncbi:hypothetical protein [Janthinobacterium sp.]|uniref:hypothetical protein n=1 Tax=Janthinobacterium sp. TaxID=1871054 RepID=UPI00293D8BF3|nr:hypothetical protein [Janthinobacterium sp.]